MTFIFEISYWIRNDLAGGYLLKIISSTSSNYLTCCSSIQDYIPCTSVVCFILLVLVLIRPFRDVWNAKHLFWAIMCQRMMTKKCKNKVFSLFVFSAVRNDTQWSFLNGTGLWQFHFSHHHNLLLSPGQTIECVNDTFIITYQHFSGPNRTAFNWWCSLSSFEGVNEIFKSMSDCPT